MITTRSKLTGQSVVGVDQCLAYIGSGTPSNVGGGPILGVKVELQRTLGRPVPASSDSGTLSGRRLGRGRISLSGHLFYILVTTVGLTVE